MEFMTHSLHDDLFQATGNIGIQGGGQRCAAVDMLDGHSNGRITVVRGSASHHLVHDNAQRIDIGTAVHTATLGLLGRDIVDGTQRFFSQGVALRHHAGNAEVGHLYGAVFQHHHVVGLNITMDDTSAMGVFQRLGDLDGKMQRLLPVENALLLHVLLQGDALDQFHDDIVSHYGGGNVVNRNDIRVTEHSDSLALGMEAAAELFVLQIVIL